MHMPVSLQISKSFRKGLPRLDQSVMKYLCMSSINKELLASKLAGSLKVPELDKLQEHLPWLGLIHGQKLAKAQELADWFMDNRATYIAQAHLHQAAVPPHYGRNHGYERGGYGY